MREKIRHDLEGKDVSREVEEVGLGEGGEDGKRPWQERRWNENEGAKDRLRIRKGWKKGSRIKGGRRQNDGPSRDRIEGRRRQKGR